VHVLDSSSVADAYEGQKEFFNTHSSSRQQSSTAAAGQLAVSAQQIGICGGIGNWPDFAISMFLSPDQGIFRKSEV
jgi:hypothetical protein